MLRWGTMALLAAAVAGAAHGQRHQLNVGDAAPKLDLAHIVAGEQVKDLERGKVYIIEFWATWCPPCRRAIPWLSTLQRKYGDDGLVIVGISDEEQATVRNFVQRNPGLFSYTVAVDNNKTTGRAWMNAAGQQGIPSSFIVDREGKIQYIGHPQGEDIELILQLVLQGRYDAKLFKEVVPAVRAYESARKVNNWRLAFSHLDQIIAHDTHVFAMFNIEKFEVKLVDMGDKDAAYTYAGETIAKYAHDPGFLASLARYIATEPKIDNEMRDLDVALAAAKAAERASPVSHPELLATLALVHFHRGKVDEAISLQRRAWMMAPPARKAGYERTLRDYQQAHQRAARTQTG